MHSQQTPTTTEKISESDALTQIRDANPKTLRVIHFVTGGFTGSTAVAIELVKSTLSANTISSTLVLRKKSSTPLERVEKLRAMGIDVILVPSWSHLATIIALKKICEKINVDILVSHGFSEHLWGRYAGLLAKVPHLIHVEHNSRERYTYWRLLQARWLEQYTDFSIACSEGVRNRLLELQFPPEKTITICNGIDLSHYKNAALTSFSERLPALIMPARFAKQKDHTTLIKAMAILKTQGLKPQLSFAGVGSKRHMAAAQKLTVELQLQDQIHFLGFCSDLPTRLMQHQICVLSSHYEGMPLALVEGMAAGCAVIGSEVVGIAEMIKHNQDGLLVKPQSAESLAAAIALLLNNTTFATQLAERGRMRAQTEFGLAVMANAYNALFLGLGKH